MKLRPYKILISEKAYDTKLKKIKLFSQLPRNNSKWYINPNYDSSYHARDLNAHTMDTNIKTI